MVFSKDDVFINVLHQERVMAQNSLSNSLQTKLVVSVVCEEVADEYCADGTVDRKMLFVPNSY